MQKSPTKISRSERLKKYEKAYNLCLQLINDNTEKQSKQTVTSEFTKKPLKETRFDNVKHSTSSHGDKTLPQSDSSKPKRPLNEYQKFLQSESKRDKYKGYSPKSRMSAIASAWKKKKNDSHM